MREKHLHEAKEDLRDVMRKQGGTVRRVIFATPRLTLPVCRSSSSGLRDSPAHAQNSRTTMAGVVGGDTACRHRADRSFHRHGGRSNDGSCWKEGCGLRRARVCHVFYTDVRTLRIALEGDVLVGPNPTTRERSSQAVAAAISAFVTRAKRWLNPTLLKATKPSVGLRHTPQCWASLSAITLPCSASRAHTHRF